MTNGSNDSDLPGWEIGRAGRSEQMSKVFSGPQFSNPKNGDDFRVRNFVFLIQYLRNFLTVVTNENYHTRQVLI